MKIILVIALVAICAALSACGGASYETRQDWRTIHQPAPDTGS